ncbi:FAD-binding monooxygenase [Tessaracoccus oleiagri]|uniref:Phenol 2-monooxygenase n=1 Tax=Tessaracoccus oleiagri TaxID=686624 RepID=A0A1G9HCE4_9ACTN|nr:FAD-binding monooxygenase [Tessaracoccus oleiagri]SDL10579.1 phenol 2-monooxygenase [Tessaracoccus oleiagri]
MQFHHHGYVSGDPRTLPAAGVGIDRSPELPDELDVLVVGAGPAGMMTAAQLSMFPEVRAAIVEKRDGRLVVGQADGIQARTVETFQAFGFARSIVEEAYRITETAFWKPDPADPSKIVRVARTPDDPTGISEFEHIIVNQARVLDYFEEFMANSPSRMRPNWGWEFQGLQVHQGDEYPVEVRLLGSGKDNAGVEKTVRAKYVVGSDGARSKVRDAIGARHAGGVSYHAWGVMDALAVTDFPDVRLKSIIAAKAGNILHIPREGGYLFRMYVDLGEVPEDDNHAVRQTPLETIIRKANEIIAPYTLEVKDVAWWSVYEVGHRVTDRFDDVPAELVGRQTPRVFITGDACHTHSAKAGQGMNVSMQDGFNLGWKLGQVLRGLSPESLLATYTAERQVIAQDLIDFDRDWSTRMATDPSKLDTPIEEFYVKTAEFPAGFMTQYKPSVITGESTHQDLAKGFPIGKRFKSGEVVRISDANPLHLGHQHRADGRWRIYVFADHPAPGKPSKSADLAEWLLTPESPVVKYTPKDWDEDGLFDVKVVYQQPYTEIDLGQVPRAYFPQNGPYKLRDYCKQFAAIPDDDIFDAREISRDGAIVVVRPDQYVAHVLPLDATDELARFFSGVFSG